MDHLLSAPVRSGRGKEQKADRGGAEGGSKGGGWPAHTSVGGSSLVLIWTSKAGRPLSFVQVCHRAEAEAVTKRLAAHTT